MRLRSSIAGSTDRTASICRIFRSEGFRPPALPGSRRAEERRHRPLHQVMGFCCSIRRSHFARTGRRRFAKCWPALPRTTRLDPAPESLSRPLDAPRRFLPDRKLPGSSARDRPRLRRGGAAQHSAVCRKARRFSGGQCCTTPIPHLARHIEHMNRTAPRMGKAGPLQTKPSRSIFAFLWNVVLKPSRRPFGWNYFFRLGFFDWPGRGNCCARLSLGLT